MAYKTALYEKHKELGGKIVEFAGWLLPVQYKKGIIKEHNAVRNAAGLFDVSHMGEIYISGENAENALQHLVTNRVSTMEKGMCRYALMLYEDGGVVDDLLIYKIDENKFFLVVNASNADKDYKWICDNLMDGAKAENLSPEISQLALQGPKSEEIMEKLCDISLLPKKNYRFTKEVMVGGIKCLVSTTGYTGEKGYELYTANKDVCNLYDKIMSAGEEFSLEPVGLGARDTLRFECCMTLYGHELSEKYNAAEAGLSCASKKGLNFIGEENLQENPEYMRVGLKLIDRGIAREDCEIYNIEGENIGITTSAGICPTISGAYAMARIKTSSLNEKEVYIDVRGRKLKAEFTNMPFYKRAD